jgi:hypothetical protein
MEILPPYFASNQPFQQLLASCNLLLLHYVPTWATMGIWKYKLVQNININFVKLMLAIDLKHLGIYCFQIDY